jgi:hypothetical protein
MEKRKEWIQPSKPWSVLYDQDFVCNTAITPQARMLYLVMLSHAAPEESPMPPIEDLCKIMGMNAGTYRKYCRELTDNGFLRIEPQRDGKNRFSHNRYVLLDGDSKVGGERPSVEVPAQRF